MITIKATNNEILLQQVTTCSKIGNYILSIHNYHNTLMYFYRFLYQSKWYRILEVKDYSN